MCRIDAVWGTENLKALLLTEFELLTTHHKEAFGPPSGRGFNNICFV